MKNRVRQTSTTTGTGDMAFASTPTGFVAFADVYTPGDAEPIYYVIEGVTAAGIQTGEWEVGLGHLTAGGALQRDTVHASSNSGSAVDFSAGTKRIYDAVTVEAATAMIGLTGIESGGGLAINAGDSTKFDVTAGVGYINGVRVAWSTTTANTATFLGSKTQTFVLIDADGVIVQLGDPPTAAERRAGVYLGQLGHTSMTSIAAVNFAPTIYGRPDMTFRDFSRCIGPFPCEGLIPSANGSNLRINVSAGLMFGVGINYDVGGLDNPHYKTLDQNLAPTLFRRTSDGLSGTNSQDIDPNNYENDDGDLESLSGTQWSVQRIYQITNGNIVVQYGRAVYNNLRSAIDGWQSENFTRLSNLLESAGLIGVLAVRRSTTELNNTARAQFIPSRFGMGAGGGGGGIPGAHASTHQDGGDDEVATTTAAAGAIPKADSTGLIPSGFLPPVTTDGIIATSNNDWGIPGEWIPTGGSTIAVPGGGALHLVPFTCLDSKTLTEMLCEVTTAGGGGTVGQFAVYDASIAANGQYQIGSRVYLDSATFDASTTGLKTSTTSPNLALVRGRSYALAVSLSDSCSLRASLTVSPGLRNRRNAASTSMYMRIDRYGASGNHPPPLTAPTIVLSQSAATQPNFNVPIWARWTIP